MKGYTEGREGGEKGLPAEQRWPAGRVILTTLVVIAVGLAFYLLYRFHIAFFILFTAVVLSVAIRPVVEWLRRRGIPRAVGVVLVYVSLVALMVGAAFLVLPVLVTQVAAIARRLPEYYQDLYTLLITSSNTVLQRLAMYLPGAILGGAMEEAGDETAGAVALAAGYVSTVVRAIFIGSSVLLLALYWTLDGDRSVSALIMRLAPSRREGVRELWKDAESKVGAYVGGLAILSLAVGGLALVAYLIIGLPYALSLGVVAGLTEVIPVVGPILGAIPPVLLALSVDPSKVIWVILAVIVIQQLESYLLVPRVMNRAVGVNPLVSILAFVAFSALFGIAGAIMAVPLAAVIQLLVDRFLIEPPVRETGRELGRDRLGKLRYRVQGLVVDVRRQLRNGTDAMDAETDHVHDAIEQIAGELDDLLGQMQEPKT